MGNLLANFRINVFTVAKGMVVFILPRSLLWIDHVRMENFIPDEILLAIFQHLEAKEIFFTCTQVSRRWNTLILTSTWVDIWLRDEKGKRF